MATNGEPASSHPTYDSSKSSDAYAKAKQLMDNKEYDHALTVLAEAHAETLEKLPTSLEGSFSLLQCLEEREKHESLAPFFFLQGSTFLQKCEDIHVVPLKTENSSPDDDDEEENAEDAYNVDMEKACEHLGVAKNILMKLSSKNSSYNEDLAQVHLRLGDLQRDNDYYDAAIKEYRSALKLRMEIFGLFDRSVANCHYMLGVMHLLLAKDNIDASEENKSISYDADNYNEDEDEDYDPISVEKLEELHKRSLLHYLASGYALGGLLGKLCGVDPKEITQDVIVDGVSIASPWWDVGDSMDKIVSIEEKNVCVLCSGHLKKIRQRVKTAFNNHGTMGDVTIFDMKDELDDIQDRVDMILEDFDVTDDDAGYFPESEDDDSEEDDKSAVSSSAPPPMKAVEVAKEASKTERNLPRPQSITATSGGNREVVVMHRNSNVLARRQSCCNECTIM